MWIGPALALFPDARARWFEGWDVAGVEVPTLWRGFLAADASAGSEETSVEITAALDEVLGELEKDGEASLTSYYLAGLLAQLAGRQSEAIEMLLHIESCPLKLQRLFANWGLRNLGRWHRAQSYFALGDSLRGRVVLAHYAAFRADGSPVG